MHGQWKRGFVIQKCTFQDFGCPVEQANLNHRYNICLWLETRHSLSTEQTL